uniref:Female-specific protein transformer n=1 Tax=Panagrellus redivivus TaxID=6233 RepID=A0A7E4W508_PANRE
MYRSSARENQRFSIGNSRRFKNRRQTRRSDTSTYQRRPFNPQQESRLTFRQRRAIINEEKRRYLEQLQRSRVDRQTSSPENSHAKELTTESPSPKNSRPIKTTKSKHAVADLDYKLDAYMKRPVNA